jgi:uncharacterized protein
MMGWMNWLNGRHAWALEPWLGLLAGVGAGVASYAYLHEPLRVRLDRLTIRLPNAAANLPRAGLRILHLSDTHFRGVHWRELVKIDSIRRACAGLEYDLLIHTGDFLHDDGGMDNVLALLDTLPRPLLGKYAVFGNHDYTTYSHSEMWRRSWERFHALNQDASRNQSTAARVRRLFHFGRYVVNMPLDLKRTGKNDVNALEQALVERGFETLHNRHVRLTRPDVGLDIYLAGVDDCVEGVPHLQGALGPVPYDAPTILLSHNPDILMEPGIEQADLILAGHTHGGQIVLPLVGAAHTQSAHLSRREVSGYLCRGKTQVYITRGIGEGIPLRLGAAPQITLITVAPE